MKMMMYFPSLFQVQYLLPASSLGGFFLPEICPLTMGHRRRVTSGTTRGIWCWLVDLNHHPFAYKATALPLELNQHVWRDSVDSNHDKKVNSLP